METIYRIFVKIILGFFFKFCMLILKRCHEKYQLYSGTYICIYISDFSFHFTLTLFLFFLNKCTVYFHKTHTNYSERQNVCLLCIFMYTTFL